MTDDILRDQTKGGNDMTPIPIPPPAQGPVAEQRDQINAILEEQAIAEKPAE